MVTAEQMENYVSAQVYALRHFSAVDGQPGDHWGFAWHPRNATAIPPADFTAQTDALLDRLAAAIHDSAEPLDPNDPGIGACGPLGQNLWCSADLAGAWLNDGWKTFTYWGRLALAFATPPRSLVAGRVSNHGVVDSFPMDELRAVSKVLPDNVVKMTVYRPPWGFTDCGNLGSCDLSVLREFLSYTLFQFVFVEAQLCLIHCRASL